MLDDKPTLLDVSTKAPATDSIREQEAALHHIRVVGGGAAGLELVTRLGDTLGRHGKARITIIDKDRTHLWKPLLHAIAAGSMDPGGHELNYLAQAHWHHFRYRFGEMIGLDRTKKEVWIAATHDEEGRQITPPRAFRYDTLVIAVGSVTNDFGTLGASQYAVPLETPEQAMRFNRRLVNACIRAHAQDEPVQPGQPDGRLLRRVRTRHDPRTHLRRRRRGPGRGASRRPTQEA